MTRCVPLYDKKNPTGEPRVVKQKIALLKLPPKIEHIELITARASEVEIYNKLISRARRLANAKSNEIHSKALFFITLLCRLRQVCCHPWLVESVNLSDGQIFCEECKNLAENPVKLTCGHFFCYECLVATFEAAEERLSCISAQKISVENENIITRASSQPRHNALEPLKCTDGEQVVTNIKCPKDQCEGYVTRERLRTDGTSQEQRIRFRERQFVSSSKIDTCLDILKSVERHNPMDKVVLFTHFVTFINILEIALEREDIPFLRLDGTMSSIERAGAIAAFQGDTKIRVLLASKLACGVGLNLTMANHVIISDPWWNHSVESQAVHRCHRIGQTKPVHIYRCLTDKSIEFMCWQIANKKKIIGDMVIQATMSGSDAFSEKSTSKEEAGGVSKVNKKLEAGRRQKASNENSNAIQETLIQSLGLK
eukprot:CAMPEP_0201531476 /NCGR_PEP_ID=MMETSP0161_2-20130828/47727_1 /ASSEMBLY_ACC=CAM_ASM_000251 /TAXON_ID=180227 /ORGANISM="Neoparamoeba aestuarina, Strain SoJaBio B1-5/56/2" /LENGTH=426 /DNA_ID=CAMNT_0047934403 /DNA_START=81 /DNA_END=1361 /DNA_ORIENTATION=-